MERTKDYRIHQKKRVEHKKNVIDMKKPSQPKKTSVHIRKSRIVQVDIDE